jgi:hypothetical protein
MKHIVLVLGIIIFVSLSFLHPSIENAVDASFNDYEYLQKLRRTRTDVNTDDKSKGWQDNGTFNSWYQKGNGSENDKALNNITPSVPVPSNSPSTAIPSTAKITGPSVTTSTIPTNTSNDTKSNDTKSNDTSFNLIPYLLLFLLLIVILVIYIKYKY